MIKKNKIKKLFIGKRSFKQRFAEAFFPSLALSFILFFFGPLDLSHSAKNYLDYTVIEIFTTCLKTWGIILFLCLFVSWVPGGIIHSWLCSLFSGLAIAFYIQGNYLNMDLGVLDGNAITWQNYGDNALINLGIFILIIMIPYLIHFFSRSVWKKFIIFTSLLLVIMQSVPLGMMLISEYRENLEKSEVRYRVLKDKEFTLGNENIVVFILDRTGPEELNAMLEKHPDALAAFIDFTYFDNYNTEYMHTYPAAAYLLTHQKNDPEIPHSEWLYTAWHADETESFYSQMANNGWESRAFHNIRLAAGSAENEYGKMSNIEKVEGLVNASINQNVYRKLIKLSFYRYFPLIMKAPFWLYTRDLNGMKNLSDADQTWDPELSIFKYWDQRLSVDEKEKVYVTYHYRGSHPPYILNSYGRKEVYETSLADQLAGQFYFISEYIRQMKDYHIYDSSTIIITSDHGYYSNPNAILFIKPEGQRQTEMNMNHAPISQSDYMETIAEFAGLDKGQFGRSFYDFDENEERERISICCVTDTTYPRISGYHFNALRIFEYTGDNEMLCEMIKNKEFESVPISYPYY